MKTKSYNFQTNNEEKKDLPFYIGIIILCFFLLLFGLVYFIDGLLPSGLTLKDEADNVDRFIAEQAQIYLKGLVDIGPRLVGSDENEIVAIEYLKHETKKIRDQCSLSMNYYVQDVSGTFYLDYQPYGSINVYNNLQNFVVRFPGKTDNKPDTVLVNAHFDTMPNSPGGSDDGIMCAVMLETIRKLCKLSTQFENNLIFLFNGAEESYLQGSHGFITNKNLWNDDIKVILNLEATGAGGKELLFQAGPEQFWLIEYYSKVPHPHAQVAGEEIFESNLIPSDSDFRIFRDFGNTIGIT